MSLKRTVVIGVTAFVATAASIAANAHALFA